MRTPRFLEENRELPSLPFFDGYNGIVWRAARHVDKEGQLVFDIEFLEIVR